MACFCTGACRRLGVCPTTSVYPWWEYREYCPPSRTDNTTDISTQEDDKFVLEGWVCPRCRQVNSPFKETCDCVDG